MDKKDETLDALKSLVSALSRVNTPIAVYKPLQDARNVVARAGAREAPPVAPMKDRFGRDLPLPEGEWAGRGDVGPDFETSDTEHGHRSGDPYPVPAHLLGEVEL